MMSPALRVAPSRMDSWCRAAGEPRYKRSRHYVIVATIKIDTASHLACLRGVCMWMLHGGKTRREHRTVGIVFACMHRGWDVLGVPLWGFLQVCKIWRPSSHRVEGDGAPETPAVVSRPQCVCMVWNSLILILGCLLITSDVVPTAGDLSAINATMPIKIEATPSYKKLNGTMIGQPYREWYARIMDEASGFTDESGSSLADMFNNIDMGGTSFRS